MYRVLGWCSVLCSERLMVIDVRCIFVLLLLYIIHILIYVLFFSSNPTLLFFGSPSLLPPLPHYRSFHIRLIAHRFKFSFILFVQKYWFPAIKVILAFFIFIQTCFKITLVFQYFIFTNDFWCLF